MRGKREGMVGGEAGTRKMKGERGVQKGGRRREEEDKEG